MNEMDKRKQSFARASTQSNRVHSEATEKNIPVLDQMSLASGEEAYMRRALSQPKSKVLPYNDNYVRRQTEFDFDAVKPKRVIVISGFPKITSQRKQDELKREMRLQCSKYGIVLDCQFEMASGTVLVTFQLEAQATRSSRKLDGRTFDGMRLSCKIGTA